MAFEIKESDWKLVSKSSCLSNVGLLLIFLPAISLSAAGQAGRKPVPQAPQTTAAPGQPASAFVPDANRDEYQLVFSKVPESEKVSRPLKPWDRREDYKASFSDDLTHVGMRGYRLVSIALSPRFAIMKRAERQYEYAVVEIQSRRPMFPNDPKFELTYAPWAQKGFRVADYFVLSSSCDDAHEFTGDDSYRFPQIDCTYEGEMVLERQPNAEAPRNYKIVNARPTYSSKKLEPELAEQLNTARKTNLYPTHLITKFQLLTQSPTDSEEFTADQYQTEIVSSDVKKKVNELAQQGYRLILRPLEVAIMQRKKGATTAASYIWVSETKLEQELPKLQEQGAIYRMNNGCWTGRTQMTFEQPSVNAGKQREYKILGIELNELENGATQRLELMSGSINAMEEFRRLTNAGFEPRDFFACYLSDKKTQLSRVKLLLERVSK